MASTPRLIVLGSGSAVPRRERSSSCYLVDDGEGQVLLVDLGPGALHRAALAGYPLERLSAILLTHIHPDHCADLVHLLFALRSPLVRAGCPPLLVVAHTEVALLIGRLRNAWPGWLAAPGEQHQFVTANSAAHLEFGHTHVNAFQIEHHSSSLGWRLQLPNGFTLAFSGDATEGAQLHELGADCDLFVLEGAVPESKPFGRHLTPRRAAQVAARCNARALLLTHLYPPTDAEAFHTAVNTHFSAPWAVAEDGTEIELRAPLAHDFAATPNAR